MLALVCLCGSLLNLRSRILPNPHPKMFASRALPTIAKTAVRQVRLRSLAIT